MCVDQVHDTEENICSPRYVRSYHTPGHSTQQMRPGIGRNASCALSDWLTSRPGGCSQPRELSFSDILIYMYISGA